MSDLSEQPADPGTEDRGLARSERGATLAEYALIMALVVGATLAAIAGLTDSSGDYLSTTGEDIGEPRERIANMDDDLPDPPAWLP